MKNAPPPPPAPGIDQASSGLFVLYEDPIDETTSATARTNLLIDVASGDILFANALVEPEVSRRVPGNDIRAIHLHEDGDRSSLVVELASGERVALLDAHPARAVNNANILLEKVLRLPATRS